MRPGSEPTITDSAPPGQRSGAGAASVRRHLETDQKRRVPTPAQAVALRRRQQTILVVDDVAAARYATARSLQAEGFHTREAATGAEALLGARAVSAIVLDVHLPDIFGFEVCRLLRASAATAAIPIVHLSAVYVSDEDKARGHSAGADAYLVAPVTSTELASTIDKLLEARHTP